MLAIRHQERWIALWVACPELQNLAWLETLALRRGERFQDALEQLERLSTFALPRRPIPHQALAVLVAVPDLGRTEQKTVGALPIVCRPVVTGGVPH